MKRSQLAWWESSAVALGLWLAILLEVLPSFRLRRRGAGSTTSLGF